MNSHWFIPNLWISHWFIPNPKPYGSWKNSISNFQATAVGPVAPLCDPITLELGHRPSGVETRFFQAHLGAGKSRKNHRKNHGKNHRNIMENQKTIWENMENVWENHGKSRRIWENIWEMYGKYRKMKGLRRVTLLIWRQITMIIHLRPLKCHVTS